MKMLRNEGRGWRILLIVLVMGILMLFAGGTLAKEKPPKQPKPKKNKPAAPEKQEKNEPVAPKRSVSNNPAPLEWSEPVNISNTSGGSYYPKVACTTNGKSRRRINIRL